MLSENVLKMEQGCVRLRKVNAVLRRALGTELPRPMGCEECRFYIQHYIRHGPQYARTNAGHYAFSRSKARGGKTKAVGILGQGDMMDEEGWWQE